ncbi:Neutrophilic granule protein [Galemys pyrenaicus]|uniref:Neutrophilic granule protein n=1 Tax=Galemys pyrenaicus TaxID=202257 RepID=A0A8J6ANB2_GALPY|nr:Neutrophilic granule protein [Galemys pyrenaicus]
MAGAWRALVLVVGLAAVACVAHRPHRRSLSYEDVVALALRSFNRGRQGQPLFRLLEATPPPSSNSTTTPIPLNFRIKETVCIITRQRQQPQDCAFREGGEERNCTGTYLIRSRRRRRRRPIINFNCVPAGGPEGESEVPTVRPNPVALRPTRSVGEYLYDKAKFDTIANILKNF